VLGVAAFRRGELCVINCGDEEVGVRRRRAERLLVTLMQNESVGPYVLVYLNRLSDLLFTLARLANHLDGVTDITWKSP